MRNMRKTVVIWDSVQADIQFFVTDRDVARFNGKYVNSSDLSDEDSNAISMLMYDENGKQVAEVTSEFPVQAVLDGASVIVTGFLP